MGLGRLLKKGLKRALPAVTKLTPAGRAFSLGSSLLSKAKGAAKAGLAFGGTGGSPLLGAVQRAIGGVRRRRRHKGISSSEMMELMKLQMLVGKRSMPYQMAVLKAITGKLK